MKQNFRLSFSKLKIRGETAVRIITELHGNQGKFWAQKKTSWERELYFEIPL